jgi:hypothetical protein
MKNVFRKQAYHVSLIFGGKSDKEKSSYNHPDQDLDDANCHPPPIEFQTLQYTKFRSGIFQKQRLTKSDVEQKIFFLCKTNKKEKLWTSCQL